MTDIPVSMPSYPMLAIVVRHGAWASVVIAAAIAVLGLYCGYVIDSAFFAVAGVVVAALAFVLARTFVELVRLITDMLLPK